MMAGNAHDGAGAASRPSMESHSPMYKLSTTPHLPKVLPMNAKCRALCTALLSALLATRLLAQEEDPRELADLDLQALMNVEVTSVSRRPERLSSAAASVLVITGDE